MSIALLEAGAAALGELGEKVVFVGGATIELWITDPAAPEVRPTKDVDVIVEVLTLTEYYEFEDRLRQAGFVNDQESGVICRFAHRRTGLILDAMPADPEILGFSNIWLGAALAHAATRELPSGATIRAVPPPFLLGTKLEAFKDRGNRDFLGSRDFSDVIALVDGREELVGEVARAPDDLRRYLADEITGLIAEPFFATGVAGALPGDAASQGRVDLVVKPRLRALASA